MPIPTDTFWNVRRLNIVFAVSSIALVLTIVWSIWQDYDKTWRIPQQASRVWDAALTEEKIARMMSPAETQRLRELQGLLGELDSAITSGTADYRKLMARVDQIEQKHTDEQALSAAERENMARIRETLAAIETAMADPEKQKKIQNVPALERQIEQINSNIDTATFSLNNFKANLTVDEGQLQDAITSGNTERINELRPKVLAAREYVRYGKPIGNQNPKRGLFGDTLVGDDTIAQWNDTLRELRAQRDEAIKEMDDLRKLTARLGGDVELLRKKVNSLDPTHIENGLDRMMAKTSETMRRAWLMGFVNPAERVQQIVLPDVLTDVSFMKIETIDRCTTCHVNIDRPEFSEGSILSYLEEQLASARGVRFLPANAPTDPTPDRPGAMGMPEFWHAYAATATPEAAAKAAAALKPLTDLVGKGVIVKVDGSTLSTFEDNPSPASPDDARTQDLIIAELLKAWSMYEPAAANNKQSPVRTRSKRAEVEIQPTVDPDAAKAAREATFAHVAAMHAALKQSLDKTQWNQLEERYRHALVEAVNVYREERGWRPLDPSPTILAHPRLDLYAEQDSPHPKEQLGCTACHDGSGQETNFVLAAHVPRGQWVDERTGKPVLPQQIVTEVEDHHLPDMSSMLATVMNNNISSLHFENLAPANVSPDAHGATTHPAPPEGGPPHGGDGTGIGAHNKPYPVATPDAAPIVYIDPLTGEKRRAVSQMKYWRDTHEFESGTSFTDVYHYWDRPMLEPQYIEANCARCHTNIHDIREEAPTLYAGRVAFAKNGCVNCHQMDSVPVEDRRRVGPDLRHVNSKLSEAFLHSWIWAPKAFRPSTRMPHFFMLENNSSEEELRRTQQEVRAISTYLVKTATTRPTSEVLADPANKMPAVDDSETAVEERIARGRAIFIGLENVRDGLTEQQGGVGCVGCHTNLNETGKAWITTDFMKKGLAEEVEAKLGRRPTATALRQEADKRYDAMSYNQRQIYAMEHFGESLSAADELPAYPDGETKPVFQHHGPELSGIGTKLLAGGRGKNEARQWLYDWLMDPRHYSANTVMPRLRLTPQEALDLAEYLLAQTRQKNDKNDTWQATAIAPDHAKINELVAQFLKSQYSLDTAAKKAVDDAEMTTRATLALTNQSVDAKQAAEIAGKMTLEEKQLVFLGQKLITHYGCMSCHTINGVEDAPSPCTNLSDWGQKALTKLDFGFTDHHKVEEFNAAAGGIATANIPMVNGLSPDAVTALIAQLNEKKFGQSITKPAEVAWPHVDHTRTSWIEHKLKNTRIYDRGKYLLEPQRATDADGHPELDENGAPKVINPGKPYEKLRMPTFYFNDEEVHAIITFVLSNRDRLISPALLAKVNHSEAKQIAQGRQIAERYNCVGCHRIESNTPAIQQYWISELITGTTKYTYFLKDDAPAKAPPSLRSEGAKVQSNWLFDFLKNVERHGTVQKELGKERRRLRPIPYVRMPSFPLTDDETAALAAYFNAVANKEARIHQENLTPLLQEAAKQQSTTTQPVTPEEVWPTPDWFTLAAPGSIEPKYQMLADYLKEWALEHTLARPNDFDPAQGFDVLAKTYKTALFDARFVAQAFPASYPFAEQFRPTPSPERLKQGERFFHYLQCHTCHVMGDDKAQGVNLAPKAPNFSLAFQRLRRDWVRQWVQEPQTIQPGNPMPAIFFSGRAIPAITNPDRFIYELHGLPHVTSSPTPELAKQLQAEFGETVQEQMDLLIDFIYAAGMTGYTSIDPPQGEPKLKEIPPNFQPAPIPGITAPLPEPVKKRSEPAAPPKEEAPVLAMASGPSIVGKVIYDGAPPPPQPTRMTDPACAAHLPGGMLPDDSLVVGPDKGVRYTVVYVTKGISGRYPVPADPAILDQKGCRYEPHVLPLMIGQQVLVKNSDPFLHNVHGLPEANPGFNYGQPNIDPGKALPKMTTRENFRVKCDVHPWMSANFVVLPHPFFALTAADGSFTINGLPPGEYTITTWHEKCPPVEMPVKVEAGKPAEVTIPIKLE